MLPDFGNTDIVQTKKAGEYLTNCMFCVKKGKSPDTHYHLNFNTIYKVYYCHRCGSKGALSEIKELFILADNTEGIGSLDKFRDRLTKLFCNPVAPEKIDLDEISWPLDSKETPIAYKYMTERGFSDEEIKKYNLRVGHPVIKGDLVINKWSGRVLFPVIESGECKYVVARSVNGHENKYINSTSSKSATVFNIENVTDGKCIICEGIISAIAAERTTKIPAVALLGKTISGNQLSKIRNRADTVYLSLDGDVENEERKSIAKLLVRVGLKVFQVDLPWKRDPDDLGLDYLEYFNKAERVPLL